MDAFNKAKHYRYRRTPKLLLMFLFVIVLVLGNHSIKTIEEISARSEHIYMLEQELERHQSILETQKQTIKTLHQQIESLEEYQEEVRQLREVLDTLTVSTFEATAYTHVAVPGVADINGTGDGITRSGTPVREGLIAVDPTVIPLGTKVWVEGFGVLLAADTGGAIKGNKIDIFMNSRTDALNWGRREVVVAWQI